ncbi:hypothetical protein [Corynebacterium flavescens]|uniref:hypothetical protein n=1 Tax=Corynebacterium flavescens TaxID=28028 RepID=UPI00289B090F|nr:hypothetical protein [Corynebacterium flavescens]
MEWWQLVLIPIATLIVTGTGAIGGTIVERRKAQTDHTSLQLSTYAAQVEGFRGELSVVKETVDLLQLRVRRSESIGDRSRRIAHLALDRVEDWETYGTVRDEAREQNDPEHKLAWVPARPPRLTDEGWVPRRRAELRALDEEPVPGDESK